MKNLFTVLLSTILLLILTSCGAPKTNPVELIRDTTWAPMFVRDTKGIKIPNEQNNPVFIHFSKDYNVNGMSGVNTFFGSCQLKRKKIRRSECIVKWSPIGLTKMAGPFMEYEDKFIQAINETDAVRLSANRLEFLKGRKLLIEFKRIPNFNQKSVKQ